jgi:hypothetical protein
MGQSFNLPTKSLKFHKSLRYAHFEVFHFVPLPVTDLVLKRGRTSSV